jgi:hypothetical protein
MLGNKKFKIKFVNNTIEITNRTGEWFQNCYLELTDILFINLLSDFSDFRPYETKTYQLFHNNNFYQETIDEKLHLKLYSEGRLIHERFLNDKTKCYVVFSNQQFESLVEQLIIGLDKYSNEKIYHYSINYKSKLNYENLVNVEMWIDGDMNDGQFMQFIKPRVFIDILDRGFKNAVFIDADVQIRSNIDDVFKYLIEIEDGPIYQKHPWDYSIVGSMYVPGPLLTEAMDLPPQKYSQGITNIMLFNQSHRELFKEWNEICLSDKINDIRKKEFMHDELIFNCLLWKKSIKPKQYWFLLNVLTLDDVNFFYNYNFSGYQNRVDLNQWGKGHFAQSFFNFDRDKLVGFHCVKEPELAAQINDFIYKTEFPDFKKALIDFYDI